MQHMVAVNGGDGGGVIVAARSDQRQGKASVVQYEAFRCVSGRVVSCVSQTLKEIRVSRHLYRKNPTTQG